MWQGLLRFYCHSLTFGQSLVISISKWRNWAKFLTNWFDQAKRDLPLGPADWINPVFTTYFTLYYLKNLTPRIAPSVCLFVCSLVTFFTPSNVHVHPSIVWACALDSFQKMPTFEKLTIEKSLNWANPASRSPIEEVKKRKIIKI